MWRGRGADESVLPGSETNADRTMNELASMQLNSDDPDYHSSFSIVMKETTTYLYKSFQIYISAWPKYSGMRSMETRMIGFSLSMTYYNYCYYN